MMNASCECLPSMMNNMMNDVHDCKLEKMTKVQETSKFQSTNVANSMGTFMAKALAKMGKLEGPTPLLSLMEENSGFEQAQSKAGEPEQHHFSATKTSKFPSLFPLIENDKFKDLSLRNILNLTDDILFDPEWNDLEPTPLHPSVASSLSRKRHPGRPGTASASNVFNSSVTAHPSPAASIFTTSPLPALVAETGQPVQAQANKPSTNTLVRRSVIASNSCEKSEEKYSSSSHECLTGHKLVPQNCTQWIVKFNELAQYKRLNGHTMVPHNYKPNIKLASWVKRQRYQYKLKMKGEPCTITKERVQALDAIGFVWDFQAASWGTRLNELKEYKKRYKHCNVPTNFTGPGMPKLATWVKCQRRQRKNLLEGKQSNMTTHRMNELNKLGFTWELRTFKTKKNISS